MHRTHGLIDEDLAALGADFVHVRQAAVAAAFDGKRGGQIHAAAVGELEHNIGVSGSQTLKRRPAASFTPQGGDFPFEPPRLSG